MQLFIAVPMTSSAAVVDFGGRRYRRFIPFNFILSLAAPHLHGVLVTSDNWSPVSVINLSPVSTTPAITVNQWQGLMLTPAINFSPVSLTPLNSFSPVSLTPVININSRISPRIFKNIQNGHNGILGGPGDTDSWKKNWDRKSRVRLPLIVFATSLSVFCISYPPVCIFFCTFYLSATVFCIFCLSAPVFCISYLSVSVFCTFYLFAPAFCISYLFAPVFSISYLYTS